MYGNNIPDRRNEVIAAAPSSARPLNAEAGAKTSPTAPAPPQRRQQQQQAQSEGTRSDGEDLIQISRHKLPTSAPQAAPSSSAPALASSLALGLSVPSQHPHSVSAANMVAGAAAAADDGEVEGSAVGAVAAGQQATPQRSAKNDFGGSSGGSSRSRGGGHGSSSDGAGSGDDGSNDDSGDGGNIDTTIHKIRREMEGNTCNSSSSSPGDAGSEGVDARLDVDDKSGEGAGAEVEGKDPALHGGVASVFPRMLAANAPDFSFARSRFDADPSESGLAR